ncbi:MAG: hypothetical protein ACK451_12885, partial [Pseudanabaena sp.]
SVCTELKNLLNLTENVSFSSNCNNSSFSCRLHCEITVLSWEKSMEMDTFIFAVLQKIISIWILLTLYSDRFGTKQSAIAHCLRMLIMMGDRCQCYRKLLALSIKRLRLSLARSRLESSLV